MPWIWIIVLLAWPAVEIATFVAVAHWIGFLGAIAGVVLSGVLGFALLQSQGLDTAQRARRQLDHGQLPVGELFDGACLAVAGLLLILPGFVTDLLALVLLMPPFRRLVGLALAAWLSRLPHAGHDGGDGPGRPAGPGSGRRTVIEGEWTVVEQAEDRPDDRASGEAPRLDDGQPRPGKPSAPDDPGTQRR